MSRHKARVEANSSRDDNALLLGAISEQKRFPRDQLLLDQVLQKADGKDIVKKSTNRKGRYLILFSGQVAPLAGGKMGVLAQLDTQRPVMYLDFQEGRLKLFGKLTFPKNKYMVLKAGSKDVLCEDIFDMLVVFSTAWWIGTKADNPEEKQLSMPEDIIEKHIPGQPSVFDRPSPVAGIGRARSRSRSKTPAASASHETDDSDSAVSLHLGTQPRASQRSTGRRAVKRPRYAEPSSDSTSGEGGQPDADDGSTEDHGDRSKQQRDRAHAAHGRSSDSSSDAEPETHTASKKRRRAAAAEKPAAKPKATPDQRPQKRQAGAGRPAPQVIVLSPDSADRSPPTQTQPSQKTTAAKGAKGSQRKGTAAKGTHAAAATSQPDDEDLSLPPFSQRSLPGRAAKSSAGQKLKDLDSDMDTSDASTSSEAADSEDGDSYDGED
ncbi:hypothetical protein WJX73_002472 [Symbiochloris irregularis]|uniref:Uncharacterized protein n=1 Tax=Symbiochloris irregularis TaxID=706552 RepID=A0AAW1P387_9CHLO